jgi:hypothetical protein
VSPDRGKRFLTLSRRSSAGSVHARDRTLTTSESYLAPEARARRRIDEMLSAAGLVVQDYRQVALGAAQGVAVREFPMATGPLRSRARELRRITLNRTTGSKVWFLVSYFSE